MGRGGFLSGGLVLPVLLGGLFVVAITQGSAMPRGAGRSAVVLGAVGLVILLAYVANEAYQNWRAHRSAATRRRSAILDLSSEYGELDRRVVWARTLRVLGGMALLFLGVWLVGFHVAIPLYLVVYLRRFAGSSWRAALLTALIFEVLIVVFYGLVIRVPWGESVLESLLGFTFQGVLGGPLERFMP